MAELDWLFARPIAHRGLHDPDAGCFENTLSAARAAIAGGFAIECDVQLSADGEAMVFHDFDLDRVTAESGPVAARSAAELGRMAIGGTGDRIPTLAALLDAVGGRVPLVVEIKSRHDGDLRLTRRVVEILGRSAAPIAVKSFDPDVLAGLRQMAPGRPRGILAQSRYDGGGLRHLGPDRILQMTELLHFERTRPDFLSWRFADLPAAAPHLARLLAGTPVMTWTVRTQDAASRSRDWADQIVFEGFTPAAGDRAGPSSA